MAQQQKQLVGGGSRATSPLTARMAAASSADGGRHLVIAARHPPLQVNPVGQNVISASGGWVSPPNMATAISGRGIHSVQLRVTSPPRLAAPSSTAAAPGQFTARCR
eukprot:TRINITY_DN10789_c1_g1_i1.p2 TRINITY_DN10789_c1_g1~~TRINITY_DN10789_c1_g1_i1.p2  ORF type:complete len:107 (+),score=17.65 TRINITY_DN10789_c1_g1_i1:603-923(+)